MNRAQIAIESCFIFKPDERHSIERMARANTLTYRPVIPPDILSTECKVPEHTLKSQRKQSQKSIEENGGKGHRCPLRYFAICSLAIRSDTSASLTHSAPLPGICVPDRPKSMPSPPMPFPFPLPSNRLANRFSASRISLSKSEYNGSAKALVDWG